MNLMRLWPFKRKAVNHNLTRQQYRVLQLMAQGQSNKEIAMNLNISHQTAKNHVCALMRRLDAHNRTDAVLKGIRRGIVNL